jgi:hypothetical protein
MAHATENVGFMALWPGAFVTAPPAAPMTPQEFGYSGDGAVEFGNVVIDHNMQTVQLTETFCNPVVILGVLQRNGGDPSTVRVVNVDETSFQLQIQEWEYLDGPHTTETISYLVVEAGHHTFPNGQEYDASRLEVGNDFQDVQFVAPLPEGDVVVFSQIISDENNRPMVTRQNPADSNGF